MSELGITEDALIFLTVSPYEQKKKAVKSGGIASMIRNFANNSSNSQGPSKWKAFHKR